MLLALGYLLGLVYFAVRVFPSAAREIAPASQEDPGFLVFLGLGAALVLYRMRLTSLRRYGHLEVMIGALTLGVSTALQGNSMSRFITFVGGVYVIVRGIDNFEKSLPEMEMARWRANWQFKTSPRRTDRVLAGYVPELIKPRPVRV